MRFRINSTLEYSAIFQSTLILSIHALQTKRQTVVEESFQITPYIKTEEVTTGNNDNRFVRLETGDFKDIKIDYQAVVDTSYDIVDVKDFSEVKVGNLDGSVIPFLFPSRYCQSDKLSRLAYDKFGNIDNVFSKVVAITDWIYNNVEYLSGSTNSETSAYDTVTQRTGVCRDFAHLGIALCRALTIPARYFTGYAYQLNPPDFHACFEAFIDGRWFIFDATRLAPLNGLIRIATGRDAADAAVASIFGNVTCKSMTVNCEVVNTNFIPFTHEDLNNKGISI